LPSLSLACAWAQVAAEQVFQEQDMEGSGLLRVTDQAAFFRCLLPGLKQKDMR